MMSFAAAQEVLKKYSAKNVVPFYRHLYKMLDDQKVAVAASEEGWSHLPFVTKEAMLAEPLKNRMFANMFEVDHLRATSGTSGKPPVFCPRTPLREMEYRTQYHDFKGAMLAFGVPAMPHWHESFQKSLGISPRVVVFDPKYPEASVRIAKAAGVRGISVFAFHIRIIGEAMKKQGVAQQITFIEICGEACTRALFDYMHNVFPHATILPFYGSSEVEDSPMGVPVRAITGEEPLALYRAKQSQFHEILDVETEDVLQPQVGVEGELVITAYPGEPTGFPLIRYRTGDMVRVVTCKEGEWTFTVIGRVEGDFLKIAGGVLRTDEMERVLRSLSGVTDRFEIHRFERVTSTGPKPEVVVHVETLRTIHLDVLAKEIAAQFRVSPARVYAEGVVEGVYLPLRCVPLVLPTGSPKKHKRMIPEL